MNRRDAALVPAVCVLAAVQLSVVIGHVLAGAARDATRDELGRRRQAAADRLFAWFDEQFSDD